MNDPSILAHTCVAGLLETSLKGVDTFQAAANESGDGLRAFFQALTRQRQEFVVDLMDVMQAPTYAARGAHAATQRPLVEPFPLPPSSGRRTEAAVLEACAREENEAVMAYEVALMRDDLSLPVMAVIQSQLNSVQDSRSRIQGCQRGS